MRTWNLKPGLSIPLLLATDMRFGSTDYCNDQTWELSLHNGEPQALALQTTYGLRARSLRIFPRFIEEDINIIDPKTFTNQVKIKYFYPNLIKLTFTPLPGINVEVDYWVPAPYVLAAQIQVNNATSKHHSLQLEWAVTLNPLPGGQRMTSHDFGMTHVLSGKTEDLAPVFLLSGGARVTNGPFTALAIDLKLNPKETVTSKWAIASLNNTQSSYQLAQETLNRNWEADIARIVRINANFIEIFTGNSEWDLAFTLAQYRTLGLLFRATDKLSNPSYVSTRLPDTGFSYRGDGSDYSHLWNGQTPLDTYFLIGFLLPSYPEIAKGLLFNFLASQTSDGFIDWKPGLAGQRSQILATPLMASLAWRIYQTTDDVPFLEQIYPKLLTFLQHWFYVKYDRDSDGIPEWNHSMQTGLDEHPLFSSWQNWTRGVDITTVESPDLCSFLYRECSTLIQIARLIQRTESIPALQAFTDHLKTAVEAGWDETSGCYQYWDRESHYSSKLEMLGTFQGSGELKIFRKFETPHRIHLEIQTDDETTHPLQIYIHGKSSTGDHRVEKIDSDHMHWHMGRCRVTSERIYSEVEYVDIQGVSQTDRTSISTIGHTQHDITNLLPLWAGIPNPERAESLVKRVITNRKLFWGRYGLRTCINQSYPNLEAKLYCKNVQIPYNCLIGEGLIQYGMNAKARELVTHIMNAVIKSLYSEGTLHRAYHSDNGQGNGDRYNTSSLPPLGFFLDVLGLRIISPEKVILSGTNPFPWPVTVKYQGLTITRQKQKTMVIFSDGQKVTLKNGKTHVVGLE